MDRAELGRAELAELVIRDKVLYQNEIYSIVHIYGSGYIEMSKDKFKVELVYYLEIKKIYW
jgi:hypothetical protein